MPQHKRLLLISLIAIGLTACRPSAVPPSVTPTLQTVFSTGSQVNLAQAGRLAGVAALEIARFSTQAAESDRGDPYTPVTTIADRETLDRFVQLMDRELDVGLVPACVADYELRFRRADGVVVTFGYQCRPGSAYFIRTTASDESLSVLGEVKLPDEFRQLLDSQLEAVEPPLNFAFRFEYGPCFTDILDTFEQTYSQDQVYEPPIAIVVSLSDAHLRAVYEKIVEIDFFSYPEQFVVQPQGGVVYQYSLTVRVGDRTYTVAWHDASLEPSTGKAEQLRQLFQLIRDIVNEQPEVQQLPPRPIGCI